MNCPTCTTRKLATQVFRVGRTFTDLPFVASGPDDGLPHLHDPNTASESFECINGHRFRVDTHVRCRQCDHGHRTPVTVMLPTRANFDPRVR